MAMVRINDAILTDIADALREMGATGGSAGKNKFNKDNYTIIRAYLTPNETEWKQDTSTSSSARIRCEPNKTYTLSLQDTSVTIFRVAVTDSNSVPSANKNVTVYNEIRGTNSDPITINTTSASKYLVVQLNNNIFASAIEGLMVEEGTSATAYEPYQATYKPQEMADAVRSISPPLTMGFTSLMMSPPTLGEEPSIEEPE